MKIDKTTYNKIKIILIILIIFIILWVVYYNLSKINEIKPEKEFNENPNQISKEEVKITQNLNNIEKVLGIMLNPLFFIVFIVGFIFIFKFLTIWDNL